MTGTQVAADRLGIGTAQFGLDYGITNRAGQVEARTVAAILGRARAAGVSLLDTAPLYGESEAALGTAGAGGFRIVSKTPKFGGCEDASAAADQLEDSLRGTLVRLSVPAITGLLIHDPTDLSGPLGADLWQRMEKLRAAGLVGKIGVSVYNGGELDLLLSRFPLDIVQLPINALDSRLVKGGQLDRLAERGVETHARSVFLQGLLLASPEGIPPRFPGLAAAVEALDNSFLRLGLSRQAGLLAAVLRHESISHVVCGVTSVDELEDLLDALGQVGAVGATPDLGPLPDFDERVLNPARWGDLR